jgi:hypothetical protein
LSSPEAMLISSWKHYSGYSAKTICNYNGKNPISFSDPAPSLVLWPIK